MNKSSSVRQAAKLDRLIGEVEKTLHSYPHGKERYQLSKPAEVRNSIWAALIHSPVCGSSIAVVRFSLSGKGSVISGVPTDAELSKAIYEKLGCK